MDDYIKRKRKNEIAGTLKQSGPMQSQNAVILRQSKSQVADLILKLEYIDERTSVIRGKLNQIEIERGKKQQKQNSRVLAETSISKSSVATDLFEGKSSNANQNIQPVGKLGSAERMANSGGTNGAPTEQSNAVTKELQQSSKKIPRIRKSRI